MKSAFSAFHLSISAARIGVWGRNGLCLNLLVYLLAVDVFWSVPCHAAAQKVYRVAIDREYVPFEFVDSHEEAQGFTPSLLRAIGEDAGVQFEFIPMNWPEAVASLNAGEVDIVNMIVTPERATQFQFSSHHSRISQAIFRHQGDKTIVDLASLAGHRVGFQKNDISLDKLADRTDFIHYIVDSKTEGLLQLNLGKTDAFLCAQQSCLRTISEYGFSNIELAAGDLFQQDFAFATRKGNQSLIKLLNLHLARIKASGQLQALDAKWLQGQVVHPSWLYQNRGYLSLLACLLLAGMVLLWNISLRKIVNARTNSLRESEFIWKFAIEGSGAGVWDWNILTDEMKYSSRLKEMLGYSDDDILPARNEWVKRIHQDDQYFVTEKMQTYLEGKTQIYVVECRLRCKDGSYKWILDRGMVVSRSKEGKPLRMIGTHADMTERKLEKIALQQSERHLIQSQAIAHIGSWTYDMSHDITWSEEMYRIFGVSHDAFTPDGESFIDLIHPDDQSAMQSWIRDCAAGQKPGALEFRCVWPGGMIRYIEGQCELVLNDNGIASHLSGTAHDITERKDVEKRLGDLLAFNTAIINQSPSGIAVYKAEGPCVLANTGYATTLGTRAEDILKQDFRNNESWRRNGLLDFANQVLDNDVTIKRDVDGESSFGKKVILECIFSRIDISEQAHLLLITNDVSERVNVERALGDSMHQLEKKELAKTRFLAAAGHDLRQPLAAANMFIYSLKCTEPTPQQNEILQKLALSMDTFGGLLDALLKVSKLDSGMIKPEYTMINVTEIIIWLEQNFAPIAREKKLGFKLYFAMKETLFVRSDIGLLKSALINLVANAIKYTSKGALLISARRRGGDVLFQVWDTGIGISEEYVEHIFDEFYQIGNPQRDRTSGLGLGLSIVKRTLALLGGEIRCRSQSGHGTVFGFRLPLADTSSFIPQRCATTALQEYARSDSFAQGKTFVVVEDDLLVAQATTACLEGMGGEVQCFYRAEDALLCANCADYYIVDYMLGGAFNGIQFLNLLRQKSDKPVNAVLVTGDTSSNFIRDAADFDWPVQYKPVDVSELLASLRAQEGGCD
ncbi:MAG: transporter substrate-binding domain-containing protein [Gallionella sp.]